jgi:hypothetical protein
MEIIARRNNGACVALSLGDMTRVMDLVFIDIYLQYILAKFYNQWVKIE